MRFEVLLLGVGAVGSRFAAGLDPAVAALTCIDRERVAPENLDVAAFERAHLGAEKARVVAGRHRARGGVGRALVGDIRYVLGPGLARAVDAVVLALDNSAAIRDATQALWTGGAPAIPVLLLTCGGEAGGYQARVFAAPGPCCCCLWGAFERGADQRAEGAPCAETTAPRASAAAAEAAARAGASILAAWRGGDRSRANSRVLCERAGGREMLLRMPPASATCLVPHTPAADERMVELGATVGELTVGTLATEAVAAVGDDADIHFGRRALPFAGLSCPRCHAFAAAPPLLLPAAQAAAASCACGVELRALGERHTVGARELRDGPNAVLTLREWGAAPGDEFVVTGMQGQARLCCRFDWRELDGD